MGYEWITIYMYIYVPGPRMFCFWPSVLRSGKATAAGAPGQLIRLQLHQHPRVWKFGCDSFSFGIWLPSGKLRKINYKGKSQFLMGKSTISIDIFQFAFCLFTRGYPRGWPRSSTTCWTTPWSWCPSLSRRCSNEPWWTLWRTPARSPWWESRSTRRSSSSTQYKDQSREEEKKHYVYIYICVCDYRCV